MSKEILELVELGVYLALRLRSAGVADSEVMLRINAEKAAGADAQTLIDKMLAWAEEAEAKIDKKLDEGA